MNDRNNNDPTESFHPAQHDASKLTRRDALAAGLGVIGLAALGIGAGFVSKQLFPQRLVYEFPHTSIAQGMPLMPTPACADEDDDPTREFDEGPYYIPASPLKTNFRLPGHAGRELVVRGRVLDTRCQPIAGAVLDFWQVDEHGVYDNLTYNYRGHQLSQADGSYELHTLVPVPYTFVGLWRAPHIHVKLQGLATRLLTTQIYFDHDPDANARAFDFTPDLLGHVRSLDDGSADVVFNFVLEAV